MTRPPFTDTHVHFYDLHSPRLRYDWLGPGGWDDETAVLGEYGAIRAERYHADDFAAETRFQNVGRVVHVQAAIGSEDPVEETRWLHAFHQRIGIPNGIVVYVDLAADDVADMLDRHLAASSLVRGVRDLRYDDYLTNPTWERGFALLGERQLVCCDDPQLHEAEQAVALAQRHPGVTLCLDHALMPTQRDAEYYERWRAALRTLASAPNVIVKISGLGMCDHAWTVDSLRPWVLGCIEELGVERAFFGSNWPVDRLYGSYGDVLDAYAEIVSDFTESEQRALFSENANRIFGL